MENLINGSVKAIVFLALGVFFMFITGVILDKTIGVANMGNTYVGVFALLAIMGATVAVYKKASDAL